LQKNLRPVNIWLSKLQTRKLIVCSGAQSVPRHTLCAWALSCWKTKNSPDILSMAVVNYFYVDFDLS